ncbi:hypothetical protein J2X36_002534 [Methylobacterium sp. BE186]|uniref:DUF6894 family protein n=1 Tax=Methylobacterium sp. BE186 TaxID=2817715 RepID=UPI002857A457|nr:hypothetical protein [Methylobacterium sp. BE186]MDR7037783.1 hypothetical protein [Methylobacterium sp. BE186]
MPLFFFHLLTDDGLEHDDIGLDLESVEVAYLEAMKAIPGVVYDFGARGRRPLHYAFEIVDAEGRHVMKVPFQEILDPIERRYGHA